MPSHIYIALGMWDDVIKSNIDSWQASVNRKNEKDLDNNAYNYHALNWLMYAYLQKGDFERAKGLVIDMQKYCAEKDAKRTRSYLIMMKGAYATESNRWNDIQIVDTFKIDDLNVQIKAVKFFTEAQYQKFKNTSNYDFYIAEIQKSIDLAENEVLMRSTNTCSGNFIDNTTSQLDIDRATVMQYELEGLKYWENGQFKEAEEWLKKAVELQFNTSFQYGPPDIVKPAAELYAEFLLDQKRYSEAKTFFNKALSRASKRKISLDGLAKLTEV
jgi:tetratricopeptide (TPR) repeat protein